MNEQWLCEQLSSLKIKESRLSTLNEIRHGLAETTNVEIKKRLLTSPELYECFEEDDKESNGRTSEGAVDAVNDILSMCFEHVSLTDNDFPRLLQRALFHKRGCIRAIALNTMLKLLQNKIGEDDLSNAISDELLRHILIAVQDEDTRVGIPAVGILLLVLEGNLENATVKETLLKALKKSEVVKCRLYEMAVRFGERSAAALEKVEFILDHALSELDNDDILLQVNILELLVLLAEHNHGLLYLEKRQVFDVIGKRVEEMDQNPLDELLIPAIMKFFSKIASVQPLRIITGHPQMIRCLLDCLISANISILPAAFDTFANLTVSPQGVLLLDQNYSSSIRDVFVNYISYLRSLPTDLKKRALSSLKYIFMFDAAEGQEISPILERWFNYLNEDSKNMQFLLEYCRNPFPDIKNCALHFVGSLCSFAWGIEALKDTAGFLEYLLDRKVEFDKDVKYLKYSIIKILADSDAFDVQTNILLRTYINEGPYFVQTVMEVAVEGNQ